MLLNELSLVGNNLLSPSPRKVWSKKIQESHRFFYSVLKRPVPSMISYTVNIVNLIHLCDESIGCLCETHGEVEIGDLKGTVSL